MIDNSSNDSDDSHDKLELTWSTAVPLAVKWLLNLGERPDLPTEPSDTLYRSFHLTAKCRYNASIRLKQLGRASFLTGTVLALGLILFPLLRLSGLRLAYPDPMLGVIQIFLAVAVLVYSVINATAHYETRAETLNECGDGIKALSRELRTLSRGQTLATDEIQEFNDRYGDITEMSENHKRSDFWLAQLQSPHIFHITGLPKLWLYMKTYVTYAVPYVVPVVLVLSEVVLILDALSVTSVFTPVVESLVG